MKRQVQFEGVRKWAGDHLLELQGEPLRVLDRFFGSYGSYVLQGCEVTPAAGDNGDIYDVAPGLVVLRGKDHNGDDVVMVVPFAGVTGVPLPIYLTLAWNVRQSEYVTGGVKPIAYDYYAEASVVEPEEGASYLLLNGETPRFCDVIQDSTHSFVTQAEREAWNRIAPTLTAYVDGVFEGFDATRIGEIRQFAQGQPFNDEDYLLCDGSAVTWGDYPEAKLPITFTTATVSTSSTPRCLWRGSSGFLRGTYSSNTFKIDHSTSGSSSWSSVYTGDIPFQPLFIKRLNSRWLLGGYVSTSETTTRLYMATSYSAWSYITLDYTAIFDIIQVGGKWVALAGRYADRTIHILTSTNLTAWSEVAVISGGGYVYYSFSNGGRILNANGRTIFVIRSAVSDTTMYSDDLVNWSTVSTGTSGVVCDIMYSDGKWFLLKNGQLVISEDNGNSWAAQKIPINETVFRIVDGGKSWMINTGRRVYFSPHDVDSWGYFELDIASGQYSLVADEAGDDAYMASNSYRTIVVSGIKRVLPSVVDNLGIKSYVKVQ